MTDDLSYQASRPLEEIEKISLDAMTAGDLCALAMGGTRESLRTMAIRELTIRLVEHRRADSRHQRIGLAVQAIFDELNPGLTSKSFE